jgi:hypothetical protein
MQKVLFSGERGGGLNSGLLIQKKNFRDTVDEFDEKINNEPTDPVFETQPRKLFLIIKTSKNIKRK